MPRKVPAQSTTGAAGAHAEDLAHAFLIQRGLVPVARNFRTRHGELDLIMRDADVLVFVEVRMRTHTSFGGAAASITAAKRERLIAAASVYLSKLAREPACRFDAMLVDGPDQRHIVWERDILEV